MPSATVSADATVLRLDINRLEHITEVRVASGKIRLQAAQALALRGGTSQGLGTVPACDVLWLQLGGCLVCICLNGIELAELLGLVVLREHTEVNTQ